MNFINLTNTNLRVLRNPANPDDKSWMLFPTQAAKYKVDYGDGELNGQELKENAVDNCYVLDVIRQTMLPAPQPNVVYIVPANIALAAVGRDDLLFPIGPMPLRHDPNTGVELLFDPAKDAYHRLCRAVDSTDPAPAA